MPKQKELSDTLRGEGRHRSPTGDGGLLFSLTPGATVISPDRQHSLTFDREGRLHLYFRRGATYKRGLASDLHLRFRDHGRQRRQLSPEEAGSIFAEAHQQAREIASRVDGELEARLSEEVLRWTPERLAAERQRFLSCYRPIAILPPDQYLSIVLQATQGCSWNRCTFCNFYMDRPFRPKSTVEFRHHVEGVKDLLGEGVKLRRGIFLADGNALALSLNRLEPMISIAKEIFPERSLVGFVDLFSGERHPVDHWRRLGQLGLRRVCVGMETGSDELLGLVNKPGSAAELSAFVGDLKRASLSVCLIVIVGLGGREYQSEHSRASIEVLESLPLDETDLVYLSPLVLQPGTTNYLSRGGDTPLTPMSEDEIEAELQQMATRIRGFGVKTSRYDIREFIY